MSKLEEKLRSVIEQKNNSGWTTNQCAEITEQECIGFAEWLRENASRNNNGTWTYFGNMFYNKTEKELFQLYQKSKENEPTI